MIVTVIVNQASNFNWEYNFWQRSFWYVWFTAYMLLTWAIDLSGKPRSVAHSTKLELSKQETFSDSLRPFRWSTDKWHTCLPIMSSIDSFEILNPSALIAFLSSRASIDLRYKGYKN